MRKRARPARIELARDLLHAIAVEVGHGDLGAGRGSLIGVVVGGRNAEFLHGVQGHRQDGGEGVAALVVHGDTVDRDVSLIAAGAVHRSVPSVPSGDVLTIVGIGDAGLHAEEVRDVAAFEG